MASSIQGPIQLPASQHNLSTYWGRVKHCAQVSDPRMLFTTSSDVFEARALISKYKNGELTEMTPDLWKAKLVLDSTLHPDTSQPVPLPFRMSSYALSNLVVTAGMLTPNLGTAGTLFWQIANQSLNVAINTANANKSHVLSWKQLGINYTAAVSASCGVALGLNAIVPRLRNVSPGTRLILSRLVPFAAVVCAGVVNVGLMRGEEIRNGISVYTEDGEEVGISKKAAIRAVGETALSRVVNATPVMAIPPLILVRLQQKGLFKNRGRVFETSINLGLILGVSFMVLPFALGIFPQQRTINVDKLESYLHDKIDKHGNKIESVIFNRGM